MTVQALLTAGFGLLLLSPLAAAAAATDAPFALVWDAPVGCPDGETVRAEVLRLAGVRARGVRRLQARATIQSNLTQGWTLALVTESDGERGERMLSNTSCQSLSDAAVVMLALLLDPEGPPARLAPPAGKSPDESRWPRSRWQLGAHGGLQTGVLAAVSPSFALSLDIELGRLSLRFVPSLSPPRDLSVEGEPGAGGRVWVASGALLGCWTAVSRRARFAPCLGWEVVRAQGRGQGVEQAQEQTVYWSSAELALVAGYRLGNTVSLELSAAVLVPVRRPRLYLEDIGTVTRPASIDLRALTGLVFALP